MNPEFYVRPYVSQTHGQNSQREFCRSALGFAISLREKPCWQNLRDGLRSIGPNTYTQEIFFVLGGAY